MRHAHAGGMMPQVDQRVAYLEGRMEDHAALMADIRSEMRDLRSIMNRGFERVDEKMDRHFMWLVGLMVGTFAALAGLLLRS